MTRKNPRDEWFIQALLTAWVVSSQKIHPSRRAIVSQRFWRLTTQINYNITQRLWVKPCQVCTKFFSMMSMLSRWRPAHSTDNGLLMWQALILLAFYKRLGRGRAGTQQTANRMGLTWWQLIWCIIVWT
jgi:hypothetical protein